MTAAEVGLALLMTQCAGVDASSQGSVSAFGLQFPSGLEGGGFSVELWADGKAEFRGRAGSATRRQLSVDELCAVRRVISRERVLEVKGEFGTCYVESPSRHLRLTIGKASTLITLCDPEDSKLGAEGRAKAARALALWVALRELFPDYYSANEREIDHRQLKDRAAER
jgi:hypothetical protein